MGVVFSPIRAPARRIGRGGVLEPFTYQPGIHLDFARGLHYVKNSSGAVTRGAITSLFTFTGGNQSMYVGPSGLLVASATNTPRIEYDPSTLACRGLLMEAARTNLALWSNDHTNAAWVKTTMTTAKTSTGPDGTASSATRLTATGANSTSLQTVTSASATRVYSVWMRRITGTGNVDMTLDNGTGWTTKAITSSWAKYEITQAAVTNPVFGIRLVTNGDAIDVYGNQMESAAFSSSLIPTTTTSVARTADSCIRTLSTEFSATAGTVVVAGKASGGQDATNPQFFYTFNDGTASNRIFLSRIAAADTARANITVAGAGQGPVDGTFVSSALFKSAFAFAANDLAHSFNGGAPTVDAAASLPAGINALHLGNEVSLIQMNGHIRTFDYYPTRKPNGFLVMASA